MDAKWICVVFAFVLVLQSGTFANGEEEVEDCPSANATFYYVKDTESINGHRYVLGVHKTDKDFSIKINSSKVRALTFDYRHNEVLFVDDEKPNAIWGVSQLVGVHLVLHDEGAQFDCIAFDLITGNLYFADNKRGVGVCVGHESNTSCTILIPNPANQTTTFSNLLLYPQRGVMFWLEGSFTWNKIIKMASLNGKHARTFSDSVSTRSLALDSKLGRLHVSSDVGTIKNISMQDHSIENSHYHPANQIFILNCLVHAFEQEERGYTFDRDYFQVRPQSSKLLLQNTHDALHLNSFARTKPDFVSMLVLDSDKKPKPNPCKNFQCDGICVLTEAFLEPLPECVCETCNKPQIKIEIQTERNPVNGFFIAATILLLLILICIVSLAVSPKLRISLREKITRVFGKKTTVSFVNQASRESTVSAMSNDA